MDIVTLKKAQKQQLDRERTRERYTNDPIIDLLGTKEFVNLSAPLFRRESEGVNPQTNTLLAPNEPAIVNCFPKIGTPDYKRIMPTDMIVKAIDSDGVWWGSQVGDNRLQKSDTEGQSWETVNNELPGIDGIHIVDSGTIIITSGNLVYRSTDAGTSFSLVLTMQADATGRWPALTSVENRIYLGEYGFGGAGKVYKSVDDGASWNVIDDQTGQVTHLHFVAEDPYNGDIWYGAGDLDSECKLRRSTDGGDTWTTIGEGSQKWRITDVVFFEDAVYFAGDGWIGDGEKFGIFKWDKTENEYTTVRSDFDHVFYHSVKDPLGRAWFVGHSHASHKERSTLPSRSVIWVMDRTGHEDSRRNTEEFIKIYEVPIWMKHTTGAGLASVFFHADYFVANGWNLGSQTRSIADKISSVYHTGVRVDEAEDYIIKLPRPIQSGAVVVAIQFPRGVDKYKDGEDYDGWRYLLTLGQFNDAGNKLLFALVDGSLYGRTRTNYKWHDTFAGNTLNFNQGDILVLGCSFDTASDRISWNYYLRNYGIRAGTTNREMPDSFNAIALGGRFTGTTQRSGGYVLGCRVFEGDISDGKLEYELHKFGELFYPNGVYPPQR